MRKPPRRLWQMIVNNWRWCQQERDKRVYEAGIAHGRLKEREAMQEQLRPVFDATPVYIPVAMLPGPYESPERHTDPMRRFLNTESLPAVPGDVVRTYHRKHATRKLE